MSCSKSQGAVNREYSSITTRLLPSNVPVQLSATMPKTLDGVRVRSSDQFLED